MLGDKKIELKEQKKVDNNSELRRKRKDLKLITNFGYSSCNWSPTSDIEKIERLDEEAGYKE